MILKDPSLMTELEMSLSLGLVIEPVRNRIDADELIKSEILYLHHIFAIRRNQSREIGNLSTESWIEMLPWHSAN
jgi:hypothetical protein